MRELFFKAKRLDNGEWVEGDLLSFNQAELEYGIDPLTICQYTGLTDKNGKRIFEGDIVRRETDYYGKHNIYDEPVAWEDDIENDSFGEPYTSGYCIHGGNWEVVGNIYDC